MNDLLRHVEATSLLPAPAIVKALAEIIRARHQHVEAIWAYGSALRDSNPQDTLIDYYVVTRCVQDITSNWLSQVLCERVPPNVYYIEATVEGRSCRAKYAALTVDNLAEKVRAETTNPYFWIRFAQPMRLVWWASESAKAAALHIAATAMATAAAHARACEPHGSTAEQWTSLFRNTYATELRPEGAERASMIVDTQIGYFTALSQTASDMQVPNVSWASRRWQGKLLSLLRLAKAAFTFQGGVDYAAWKIKRHSGIEIEVKPWHRRHPFIASLVLLPQLLRKGALK